MYRGETLAVLALGANQASEQGTPSDTLEAALALLEARGVKVLNRARWMRSPAWPAGSGPDYVNGAALVETSHSPHALLSVLHKVEAMLGRERSGSERWAARPCDLDLICCGAAVMPGARGWQRVADAPPETARETLILPHPLMHARAFVLKPMADIAPDWRHPVLGRTVTEMLADLPSADRDAVEPLP